MGNDLKEPRTARTAQHSNRMDNRHRGNHVSYRYFIQHPAVTLEGYLNRNSSFHRSNCLMAVPETKRSLVLRKLKDVVLKKRIK